MHPKHSGRVWKSLRRRCVFHQTLGFQRTHGGNASASGARLMDLAPDEFRPLVELAAEHTSDGLLCLDGNGTILMANDSASRTLGVASTMLRGKTIFEIAPEMNPSLWKELWKEIRAQQSFAFEFVLLAAENRTVHVDMSVHFLRPGN